MTYLMRFIFELAGQLSLLSVQISIFQILMISALFNLFLNRTDSALLARPAAHPLRARWLGTITTLLLLSPGCVSHLIGQSIQSPYPALQQYASPSPAPAAPGDAFAPAMSSTAAATAPACAEWTRTAGPDESVLVTGNRLSKFTGTSRGKDTRFVLYDGTTTYKEASVQRLDSGKAVITLPQATGKWGMYLVWPGNGDGYGRPIAINQTDAWWVGPDKATRGALVSVFGRNLAHNNDTLTSYVFIKPAAGAGQWAPVKRVNPYKVDFVVPDNLANGDYEVWTHNGHGQQYGWSGPLKLTINDGVQWAGTTLNVKSYGATGNGVTDDTQAIAKALAAAKQVVGSTVYFPAGIYSINSQLSPTSNTRWKGDGKSSSVLKCATNFSASVEAMVEGSVENFEVRDMAFLGNKSYRGTHPEPIFMRGSTNLRFTNVLLSFQNFNVMQLDNSYGVFLTNCELIGKTSFLGQCSQLFINGCQFKLTNDAEMALDSWGGSFISLTNSTCQDYDNSNTADGAGWGKGRFYAGRGNAGSSRMTYVGDNQTINLAVRPVGADQNSGEQFMWEGYSTDWSGAVAAATATTATLSGFSATYPNSHYAVIIKGTGQGQSRRVTAYNGNVITLESAWNLPPDNTSVISLANVNDRAVMYRNTLDGKRYAMLSPDPNASSGIEPYGATVNFIATNNTLSEVRVGIANWATQNQKELDINYFGLFANNTMTDCRWGILNGLYMDTPKESAMFGTTYRQNQVINAQQSAIANLIPAPGNYVVLSYFIYEHNVFQSNLGGFSTGGDLGMPQGYPADGKGIEDQFFYRNTFKSATAAGSFGIKGTNAAVIRENTLDGFAQTYAAPVLSSQLEAPFHVLELSGTTRPTTLSTTLTLWNSGATSLDWTATSDAAWLTLPVAKGTIQNEKMSNAVTVNASTTGLAPGTYTANIVVTVGGRIKKYSVVLKVTAAPVPTVGITAPTTGSQMTSPATVTITAEAAVVGGTISKVEFFANGTKLGEATGAPYSYAWAKPAAGSYKLTARAITATADTAVSSPVSFTVSSPLAAVAGQQAPVAEIFPNPALDKLTINGVTPGSITYKLYTSTAALLLTGTFVGQTVLNISALPDGFYFLELLTTEARVIRKFVKAD